MSTFLLVIGCLFVGAVAGAALVWWFLSTAVFSPFK